MCWNFSEHYDCYLINLDEYSNLDKKNYNHFYGDRKNDNIFEEKIGDCKNNLNKNFTVILLYIQ